MATRLLNEEEVGQRGVRTKGLRRHPHLQLSHQLFPEREDGHQR